MLAGGVNRARLDQRADEAARPIHKGRNDCLHACS
jgi:hypothetical protein